MQLRAYSKPRQVTPVHLPTRPPTTEETGRAARRPDAPVRIQLAPKWLRSELPRNVPRHRVDRSEARLTETAPRSARHLTQHDAGVHKGLT